jgi:hypothetical protein
MTGRNYQVEKVPEPRVFDVLHHKVSNKVVRVVAVAVEVGRKQSQELAFLKEK